MRFILLLTLIGILFSCGPQSARENPLEREEEVSPGDFRDANQTDSL